MFISSTLNTIIIAKYTTPPIAIANPNEMASCINPKPKTPNKIYIQNKLQSPL